MFRRVLAAVLSIVLAVLASPGGAAGAPEPAWSPPVDGPIVRGYEPPEHPFGPRHLGLDYAAGPGTPVRAAGDGLVTFAGLVGGSRAVGVEHGGGRRTTYAYLRRVTVRAGTPVRRGQVVGISGGRGPRHGPGVVHFGYRVAGRAQDPAPLFERPRRRISLAPVDAPACRYTGRRPDHPESGIHMPADSIGVRP